MHHMHHYGRLLAMVVLSYLAMFAFMYAVVDTWTDVYPNINQAYMAALMTAPMVVIEILLCGQCIRTSRLILQSLLRARSC